MSDKNDGPWGGGNKPNGKENPWGKKPSQGDGSKNNPNDIDRIIREGQDRFRRVVGGGGGNGNRGGQSQMGRGQNRFIFLLLILGLAGFWIYQSFHVVQATDRALVMRFGKHVNTWDDGLHFAPWPIYNVEKVNVTEQQTEQIGRGNGPNGQDWSLMLTSDENIIDLEFEVVWRIKDLAAFQLNIQGPRETIHAVAQSSIREVVARSPLIPLLNTKREETMDEVKNLIQDNLDAYDSGIEIVRANLTRSEPPQEVIADFEDVQAAEQERDTLRSRAQAQANVKLANARGEEAQLLEDAEAYKARVINDAEGEASRFTSVLDEYKKSPDVIRRRLYLDTMQQVYGNVDKVIVDESSSQGVVPYLPLNELGKPSQSKQTEEQGAGQ